jgi:aspartate oxidase
MGVCQHSAVDKPAKECRVKDWWSRVSRREFLFRRGWKPTMVGIEACEMRNNFCCAKLVVKCALARHGSWGLHFTEDFPYLEEKFLGSTCCYLHSWAESARSSLIKMD